MTFDDSRQKNVYDRRKFRKSKVILNFLQKKVSLLPPHGTGSQFETISPLMIFFPNNLYPVYFFLFTKPIKYVTSWIKNLFFCGSKCKEAWRNIVWHLEEETHKSGKKGNLKIIRINMQRGIKLENRRKKLSLKHKIRCFNFTKGIGEGKKRVWKNKN